MASRKKSRKVGQIGIRSVPKDQRTPKQPSTRVKKHKGNASGSRNSVVLDSTQQSSKSGNRDPRAGSKKPVPLVVENVQKKAPKPKYFSPAQELDAIENDKRLATLMDKLDAGNRLSADDQAYVDKLVARHKVLCDLLGIKPEEEEVEEDEIDLYEQYEKIDINDFNKE